MMRASNVLLVGVAGMFFYSCTIFKTTSTTSKSKTVVRADTTRKVAADSSSKPGKPKPYQEIITAKAKTDRGLFTVHKIDQRYFFEIPDSLLDKDILVVSRIAKAAADVRISKMGVGYAGDQIGECVINFSKGPDYKLFIKIISYTERSADSSENGMYRAVRNSNLNPIYASFDIKAFSANAAGSVIDVTDFINSDNSLLYFDNNGKKIYTLGGLQKDKSYIENIAAFPINVELQAVNTYSKDNETATYGLNTSFVLLPQLPMQPRYYDERVGYFNQEYVDFDKPQGVDKTAMITRWRLEPKEEDKEKYLRGELVDPQKPIVYYIDPITPKKWVPYLIQGVNDWQKAFEKAGFKNAIYALEAPTGDSSFNLYDARHNAIIYMPSSIPNARGPHVHDPRTGEILETHINWYHNVMQLIHNWYMVQASPNDPNARKMVFDDSLMGQLIRFVSSHEVGHTLGLMHNFGSSSTIPVDSLRSKAYVEKNGFCPSIMDYARFNYVAQPQDGLQQKDLFPRINVYDKWAIEWGYRWLPQLKTREEERTYMNQWIIRTLEKDKRLWYGPQGLPDPRCQSEDLGDDAVKASYYGIENLKRILPNLIEWTREPNKNYASLSKMNMEVFYQYFRYASHVMNTIGYYKWTSKTVEQPGSVMSFTSKKKQREAVQFLQQQVFETPYWLMRKDIFELAGGYGPMTAYEVQNFVLSYLVRPYTFVNMYLFQTGHPDEAYTFDELLTDLEAGIWKELKTKEPINIYRRVLQRTYMERLVFYFTYGLFPYERAFDYLPITHRHAKDIVNAINQAIPAYKDRESKNHLMYVRERLNEFLNPNRTSAYAASPSSPSKNAVDSEADKMPSIIFELPPLNNEKGSIKKYQRGCWENIYLDKVEKFCD